MDDKARDFFRSAIETPSPSGYEEPIQSLIRSYIAPHSRSLRTDVHGNLIASIGNSDGPRLMYAGHCDQIGMIVSYIDDNGFVYAQTIGGWDPQQLIGQAMTIWTAAGPVVLCDQPKTDSFVDHSRNANQVVQLEELWLDVGAGNHEEAKAARCAWVTRSPWSCECVADG